MQLPLKGITVLEFSQYLSGPCAGLRLADLGARVIKIERPLGGEAGRRLAIKDMWVGDDSLLFHTINRNKESFTTDFDDANDRLWLNKLIAKADVIIENFRPGVMDRKGLGYEAVRQLNSAIVYTSITGYGNQGPWKDKPGQDLLVQSLSGLAHTSGNGEDDFLPFGLAMGDYLCGNQAVQAILAALIRRKRTGKGSLLQLSLLESLIDFQFEFFTTYFHSGALPKRSAANNAHALLSAPYGIYQTKDGYLAVAMMPLSKLNEAIACVMLESFDEQDAFTKRDEIKAILQQHLLQHTTAYWLEKGRPLDLWIAQVMNWRQLMEMKGYTDLKMEQWIQLADRKIKTTRCPIRINGQYFLSTTPAPVLGADTQCIKSELAS